MEEKLVDQPNTEGVHQTPIVLSTSSDHNLSVSADTDIYTLKKSHVLVLLIKLLYWAIVVVLLGIGIYFLYKSRNPIYRQEEKEFNEISSEWNQTKYADLQEWKIHIRNIKNDSLNLDKSYTKYNTFVGSNKLPYKPFEFVKNNTVSLLQNVQLEKKGFESSYAGYNLTTSFYLTTDNTFSKKGIKLESLDIFVKRLTQLSRKECTEEKSSWNYENEACYQYYILSTLCIIIDQTTRELYYDYKSFKCNGFDKWYQRYSFFPWTIPNIDPNFEDIEESGKKISVYVSTNDDPYVYASYNNNFVFDSRYHFYSKCGVWSIAIGLCLIIIPLILIVRDYYDGMMPVSEGSIKVFKTSFKTNPIRL